MHTSSRLARDTAKVCEELDYELVSDEADESWQDWRLEEEDGTVKTVSIDFTNNEVMVDIEADGERIKYREYSAAEGDIAYTVKLTICR